MNSEMDRRRNGSGRSVWRAGILIGVMAIAIVAIGNWLFSGLGGLREGIAIARREYANTKEISRRAAIVYLWKAKDEVSMARSSLIEQPDELYEANIYLGVAEIELDHARCVARCIAPETTLWYQTHYLRTQVTLARGEMAIAAKIAIKRLDRVRAQIDDLVTSIEHPDTTDSRGCPILPRNRMSVSTDG